MNKQKSLKIISLNLVNLNNSHELFLYLIKISKFLPKISKKFYCKKFLVQGCQNNVWLYIKINKIKNNKFITIYSDSESLIIKGILYIIFIFYHNIPLKIIKNKKNIIYFFKKKNILNKLSLIRKIGILNILNIIIKNIQ